MIPHKCPVCDGEGMVFPNITESTDTSKVTCNGCHGTGIVWSGD